MDAWLNFFSYFLALFYSPPLSPSLSHSWNHVGICGYVRPLRSHRHSSSFASSSALFASFLSFFFFKEFHSCDETYRKQMTKQLGRCHRIFHESIGGTCRWFYHLVFRLSPMDHCLKYYWCILDTEEGKWKVIRLKRANVIIDSGIIRFKMQGN